MEEEEMKDFGRKDSWESAESGFTVVEKDVKGAF